MSYKRGLIKRYLAESLRKLIEEDDMNKITVMKICSATGVIRATFYNYFKDKNDCMNYIIYQDLVKANEEIIKQGSFNEITENLIFSLKKHQKFYEEGFKKGNCEQFRISIKNNLEILLNEFLKNHRNTDCCGDLISNDILVNYYSEVMAQGVYSLFKEKNGIDFKNITTYADIMTNRNIKDFIAE